MSKHTPGTWTVEMGTTLELIVAQTEDGPLTVAEVLDDCYPDGPMQRANARLLSAAPDLLEALEMICDSGCWLADVITDKMLAAIAKAKGV